MKKLFTRFGKFAIVLIALDLAVAITIIACSALFLTGCGDEYILPEEDVDAALPLDEKETEEEIRERELEELAAFEPYIDEDDGMVHVSPWFAYPREVVEIKDYVEVIENPREILTTDHGGTVYTLLDEEGELVDNKLMAVYRAPCNSDKQCYYEAQKMYIYKCWGEYKYLRDRTDRGLCPEEGRY